MYNPLADDFPAPLRDHCLRPLIALSDTGEPGRTAEDDGSDRDA